MEFERKVHMDFEPQVEMVSIRDLTPYKHNAKIHSDEQVKMIANSIKEFGFNNPILIDDDGGIIAGHGRIMAAVELGMDEVPCIHLSHLSDEQKRAYILADNKLAELAEWDEKLVDFELLNIENIDMSDFGFDGFDELDEDKSDNESKQKHIESMELKAFEHHDYLVFVFENQFDWMKACEEFNIHKVDAGYGETKKVGVGRVVRGEKLLEKIGHPLADNQQGQEQVDSKEHMQGIS